MGSNEKAALIKRLSAYIENTENEEYFQSMFSLEEQNILQTVAEFEKMRWKHNEKLKEIMDPAFEAVWNIAHENNTTLRMGAYLIAVKRVVDAKQARAIWP